MGVFSPNQIKSADPVTYDADGNVIPLSQRFDQTDERIAYTSAGAGRVSEFSSRSFDFDDVGARFEMPLLDIGPYTQPKNLLEKLVLGDADVRLTRLYRDA